MQRVAALTDRRGASAFVSPFFEMAPWILVHDSKGGDALRWIRNEDRDRRRLRRRIVDQDVDALVCGWIDRESLVYLMCRSVSVFIAPCDEPAAGLAADVAARRPTAFATLENLRHP
ncbi:hypothetical protein [Caenispirillum bisanense]|uniref:Predicted Fe-Mo cluster-binding protein, NifX family n=1 Tax=Caenispirillum bisanense TaxID=414052 RepID=A0A286GD51_9PROT|nr:hypothetical protein [Caenispirillum bisanense]SOD93418.1 Predicted Fe-Mo cluster-binding protein, NifX family [Caenispirillum bisanense]